MQARKCASYEEMSRCCAREMADAILAKPDARVVLATGHSPRLGYQLFVREALESGLDVSRVTWIKLDEWLGLPGDDPATCEHFLRTEILGPLGIADQRYIGFDPLCADAEAECARIGRRIHQAGGIDLAILGIGKNGHLGLNEPDETLSVPAHAARLSPQTLRHEMLSNARHSPEWGVTLGLGDLFAARKLVLLAAGEGKQQPLAAALGGQISTEMPVSLLQLHQNCVCYTDR